MKCLEGFRVTSICFTCEIETIKNESSRALGFVGHDKSIRGKCVLRSTRADLRSVILSTIIILTFS